MPVVEEVSDEDEEEEEQKETGVDSSAGAADLDGMVARVADEADKLDGAV
jgi:hypothetical protein